MKLSKAQEDILANAKRKIDEARAYDTFEEYKGETDHYCKRMGGAEFVRNNIEYFEFYRKYWENARQGMPLVTANSRTIKALEKLGLIEIVSDGGSFPDTIKVINY